MEMKMVKHDAGHITKMAAISIYGKSPSKIPSGMSGPIFTKLSMQHLGLLLIIVCSNDDARSNFVTYAFL